MRWRSISVAVADRADKGAIVAERARLAHTGGRDWLRPAAGLSGLAAATALLFASAGATAGIRTGLYGTVYRSPTTPVCRVGVPCSAPAPGVVLSFSGAGVVRETRSAGDGHYAITLPPGTYTVRTSSKPFGVVPQPTRVRVPAGAARMVDFTIDTGIR